MLYRLKPASIDNTTYFIIFRTSENAFFSLIFLLHWWLCAVSGGHLEKIDIRVALSWHFGKSFSTKFHKTLNNFMNNLDTDRVRFAKIAGPANMPWVFFLLGDDSEESSKTQTPGAFFVRAEMAVSFLSSEHFCMPSRVYKVFDLIGFLNQEKWTKFQFWNALTDRSVELCKIHHITRNIAEEWPFEVVPYRQV